MCLRKVREWLVLITMENYVDTFIERGYVTIEDCRQIISSDLLMLGIDVPAHRRLILNGVELLNNSPNLLACNKQCELHATQLDKENIPYNHMDICNFEVRPESAFFKEHKEKESN